MSVVPPKFRNTISALIRCGISSWIIRYRFPDNGGNIRWSLLRFLCWVQSSKATFLTSFTGIFTCHSLSVHPKSKYSSSSMLLSKYYTHFTMQFVFVKTRLKLFFLRILFRFKLTDIRLFNTSVLNVLHMDVQAVAFHVKAYTVFRDCL